MRRLIVFALIVVAAWFAWNKWGDVLLKKPSHEAVVENLSGREMVSVRLTVGGQTFVKESLPDEQKAVFPFRVSQESTFDLAWLWGDAPGEETWSGGFVPRGPMQQRHVMTVDGDGNVSYRPENK